MSPQKLIMLGDSGTGKTALLNRLLNNEFTETSPNIGTTAHKFTTTAPDGSATFIPVFDTAGAEEYDSISSLFFRGATIACIVISNDIPRSIQRARKFYEALRNEVEDCVVMLLQNKSDLASQLDEADVAQLRADMGVDPAHFFITSAKTGEHVAEAFHAAAAFALRTAAPAGPAQEDAQEVNLRHQAEPKTTGCCGN